MDAVAQTLRARADVLVAAFVRALSDRPDSPSAGVPSVPCERTRIAPNATRVSLPSASHVQRLWARDDLDGIAVVCVLRECSGVGGLDQFCVLLESACVCARE